MVFNQCANCGKIRESATVKLNKLKKNLDEKIYEWKWADPHELTEHFPTLRELSEWSDKLDNILKEI